MAELLTQACEITFVTPPPVEVASELSPRIRRLRGLALSFANELNPTEREKAIMDAHDENRAQPVIIRRARSAANVLETQSLVLDEGQLIAGRVTRLVRSHYGIHAKQEWKGPVPMDFQKRRKEWYEKNVSVYQKLNAMIPAEERRAMQAGVYHSSGLDEVHRNSRFQMLLELGIEEIKKQAEANLRSLDETKSEDAKRKPFYQAVIIVCDAMMDYAERWAGKLDELANAEDDPERRFEIQGMAAICRRVPRYPAETFHEAIQSVWFVQVANWAEAGGTAHSFGRFDQYMWRFYEADMEAGRLTKENALELLECLWLNCYGTFDFRHLTVGGIKPGGTDGTNELSYLCLEATERLRTPRDIAVRIHKDTPGDFLKKAVEVVALGMGRPDFWNDEVTIEALTKAGIPLDDARDYSPIGCVELTIAGKCNSRTMGHSINLSKCLELALNNGRDQINGEKIGLETGETLDSYEKLHKAYRRQAEHFIRLAIQQNIRAYQLQAVEYPMPVLSMLTVGCMESGRDVMDGGAVYNPSGVNLFGVANVANSLAAIKKLVFEEKIISFDELREALKSNFDGQEALRRMLINRGPKYGNGDEYVDKIASEEATFYCDEVAKYPTPEGGRLHALIFGVTGEAVYGFANKTGASADGRKTGEHLAMSATPAHGTEKTGATALLKSVARLDYTKASGGISFILDLHPTAISGDHGLDKLVLLLKTFFQEGGMEVGLNIVSKEEMRKAQKDPEHYSHLMVRVFGFSTQFISLSPELQEYVIEKTKQAN